jgi:multiple sugar transport system substrate-binding protein
LAIWKETLNYAPPGSLQNGNTETRDLFAKGLTAMVMTWDSALGTLFTSPVKDKWAIAQVPGRSVLGGWMLSVNASSKNKEAAFLFTQYVTNQKSDHISLIKPDATLPALKLTLRTLTKPKIRMVIY